MRVLALTPYPVEAATTRFRLVQLQAPLAAEGIFVDIRPLLDKSTFEILYDRSAALRAAGGLARGVGRGLRELGRARRYDAVVILRELFIIGPPVVEWLLAHTSGRPLILDLDDPTYVAYPSPTYGALRNFVRPRGKTDHIIGLSSLVTCGSRVIERHCASLGRQARLVPTVADTSLFRPRDGDRPEGPPVVGWIGSHSTAAYLDVVVPALEVLARSEQFRVRIVGSGRRAVEIAGVDVETVEWRLEREVAEFRALDIGLYPIVEDPWSVGKSGLKAIQYLSVGIPYVASPVGAAGEIGEPGVTHLLARTTEEWRRCLGSLLADADLRRRMGAAGRRHALEHYQVASAATALGDALRGAVASATH